MWMCSESVQDKTLPHATNTKLYTVYRLALLLMIAILLYSTERWSLALVKPKRLKAFHDRYIRSIRTFLNNMQCRAVFLRNSRHSSLQPTLDIQDVDDVTSIRLRKLNRYRPISQSTNEPTNQLSKHWSVRPASCRASQAIQKSIYTVSQKSSHFYTLYNFVKC